MNLGQASIVLRHRQALEVVDLTLRFVRSMAPKHFLKLSALFLLPVWLLTIGARHLEVEWLEVWLIALVSARILELPFTILCGHLLFEPDVTLRQVLKESWSSLGRTLVGLFFYAIILGASLILIIGPLFVGANYFFLSEVIVLERSGPFRAFKRSHQFLAGRSGTGVEGLMLRTTMLLAFIVLAETLGQAIMVHALAIHTPIENLWEDGGSPLALFGLFAFVPYAAAHRFLAYTNERTRQDGWDIQVAFLRLAADAQPRGLGEKPHAA
jgi:hypothetical protein